MIVKAFNHRIKSKGLVITFMYIDAPGGSRVSSSAHRDGSADLRLFTTAPAFYPKRVWTRDVD
jgi:hypothetical protein